MSPLKFNPLSGNLDYAVDLYAEAASQNLGSAGTAIVVTDGLAVTPVTTSGTYTLSATPTIAAGRDGQLAIIVNTGSNNFTLQDQNALGGSGLRLNATNNFQLVAGRSMIALVYDSTLSGWCELYRSTIQAFAAAVATFTMDGSSALTAEVAAASTLHSGTAPTFAVTYTGVPSTASIDISGGEVSGTDYPITLPSAYTSLTAGTSPPSKTFYRATTIGGTRVFTVTATVSGTAGLTRTVTITYYNSRYGGINTQSTALSSAQTVALGAVAIDNTNIGSFSANATGANYVWYAYRSALGQNSFWSVDGEAALFDRIGTGTVSVTNGSGFVETFEQYRSHATGWGNHTYAALSSAANNRIFMGPDTSTPVGGTIASANILALDDTANGTSIVSGSLARDYAVTIGSGKYLWFCHPAALSLNTIIDVSTGFAISGSYRTNTNPFTNDWSYQADYKCWCSDNPNIFPSGGTVRVT